GSAAHCQEERAIGLREGVSECIFDDVDLVLIEPPDPEQWPGRPDSDGLAGEALHQLPVMVHALTSGRSGRSDRRSLPGECSEIAPETGRARRLSSRAGRA